MAVWPASCATRALGTYTLNGVTVPLPAEAQCGAWEVVFDDCRTLVAAPNWQFRNVDYGRSGTGSCPSGWSGSASWTEQWQRREMNRNDEAGWVVVARRQKPGTSTQWSYSCSRSGTGSCPSGQVGTATWTQNYGQSQVWNYGGCTTPPPQPPPDPDPPDPVTPDPDPPDPVTPDPDPPSDDGPGEEGPGDSEESQDSDVPEQDTVSDPNFGGPVDAPDDGNANGGGGGGKPIVLDLDGDGVELVPLEDSTAFFDINGDGYRTRMAWAAPDDGFLAYDKDGDGAISDPDELSFLSYVEDAETDLSGLRHFDTDGDGHLNPEDAEWGRFRVWQDLDQDGESDAGELRSLDEAGILRIPLTADSVKREVAGSTVYGEAGLHEPAGAPDLLGCGLAGRAARGVMAVPAVLTREPGSAERAGMVTIRFSETNADIAARVAVARRAWQETDRSGFAFDESIVRRGIERKINNRGKYCLLQAEVRNEVVGMLMGVAAPHFHAPELGASLLSWYVLPEYRGSQAAIKLLHGFRRWARNRGAVRLYIGVTSGIDVARTDRLLRRLGFRPCGGNYEAVL